MIKIDMDMEKNTIREVSCQGDIMTILAELSFAIGQIYHDLHTLNPTAGNAFRKMVIRFHDNSDEVVIIRCVDGSTRRVDVTGLDLQQSVEIILAVLNRESMRRLEAFLSC